MWVWRSQLIDNNDLLPDNRGFLFWAGGVGAHRHDWNVFLSIDRSWPAAKETFSDSRKLHLLLSLFLSPTILISIRYVEPWPKPRLQFYQFDKERPS